MKNVLAGALVATAMVLLYPFAVLLRYGGRTR